MVPPPTIAATVRVAPGARSDRAIATRPPVRDAGGFPSIARPSGLEQSTRWSTTTDSDPAAMGSCPPSESTGLAGVTERAFAAWRSIGRDSPWPRAWQLVAGAGGPARYPRQRAEPNRSPEVPGFAGFRDEACDTNARRARHKRAPSSGSSAEWRGCPSVARCPRAALRGPGRTGDRQPGEHRGKAWDRPACSTRGRRPGAACASPRQSA